MTAASIPAVSAPRPTARRAGPAIGRLLRLELRRNAMLWMMPVAAALFYYNAYRSSMQLPAMWNLRATTMQHGALLDFVPPVIGAAAWMGWRDGRRRMTDLVTTTAWPRWAAQLVTWCATTFWALVTYFACVGVTYAMIARQATWGGPLWWPAAVGAAGIPALSAVGFAAGAFFPSRFTTPLITVAAFFALGLSSEGAHTDHSLWLLSPQLAGSADIGPDAGVGTFYHYLPDLSIAQVIFLAGLALAALGVLGLPASADGRRLRQAAAVLAASGLAAAITAVALVGTGRPDPHGMVVIPALHDAADDRPISYTPVCSRTQIPVCLNPAYAAYLPTVTAALNPLLAEVAGLPGAPARISQNAPTFAQVSGNGVTIGMSGPLVLPDLLPGEQGTTAGQFAAMVRSNTAVNIVARLLAGQSRDQAQQAVAAAMLKVAGALPLPASTSGSGALSAQASAAARRFATLPATERHAWLATHLAALRAGQIAVGQLP
ncbi:MAG: hypothetical protein ACLQFR_30565 [Streptosporangiaceae bacterium]